MTNKIALLTILATLILAAGATAATPIRWAPAKMASALKTLGYPPKAGVDIWTTSCKGASVARHGTYTAFRCTVTYYGHSTATVWAKPMAAGRVCASTRSLAACQPLAAGLLAGDPTVCEATRPTPAEKAQACAQSAAKQAVLNKHGSPQVNLICTQGATVYIWSCTASSGTYQVTFTKGATAWTTTVTP